MTEQALIIVEGQKREKQILTSLKAVGLFPIEHFQVVYGNHIYALYQSLSKDEGTDIIGILKSKGELSENYDRNDFSDIYLFFDYDPQAHRTRTEDKQIIRDRVNQELSEMLAYFDNETEDGKLFISYPMVESLRPCQCFLGDDLIFFECHVDYVAVSNFKKLSNEHALNGQFNYETIDKNIWFEIVNKHCKKANFLLNSDVNFPQDNIEQISIFDFYQLNKKIYTLSAFPMMLLHYYGAEGLLNKINHHKQANQNEQL